MPYESLSNRHKTTLVGASNSVQTTATIASATNAPLAPYRIVVHDAGAPDSNREIMLVGARSGTSLSTITRGVEDTASVAHASGSTVAHVLTARGAANLPGWENVRSWGATGGGVTNDTTAFTAARDAAGINGTVYVPAGTYLVNALSLNISGQNWILAANATIRLANGQNADLVNISASDVSFRGSNWTSVIDGNKANQVNAVAFSVNGIGVARVKIAQLKVINSFGLAGLVFQDAADCEVDSVWITGQNQHGIFGFGDTLRTIVRRCRITGGPATGGSHGIAFHSTNPSQAVDGCRVLDNYVEIGASDGFGIEIGAFSGVRPKQIVASRNTVIATANCDGGISFESCDNSLISDNLFDAAGQTIDNCAFEFAVCNGCLMSNNHTANCGASRVGVSVDQSNRCIVQGNYVQGWRTADPGAAVALTSSVASEAASDNIVTANTIVQINSSLEPAIHLQSNAVGAAVDRNIVTGNRIIGNATPSSLGIMLELNTGSVTGNLVTNNNISSMGVGISQNGLNNYVDGNMFVGCTVNYSDTTALFEPSTYVYAHGVNAALATATLQTLPANGGSVAFPVVFPTNMAIQSFSWRSLDTASARSWEMRLYRERGDKTLEYVSGVSCSESFTPTAPSTRTVNVTVPGTVIPAGSYWVVLRNTHATSTLAVGTAAAGTLALNTCQTKTLRSSLGATLDATAATWTKRTYLVGARLNPRHFGQTSSF